MEFWGKHLIVDAAACKKSRITDPDNISAFAATLVEQIGMTAFGDPLIAHFGGADPDAAGYSLVQLIETSSIVAHFAERSGDAYIDVFSCRDFETETAIRVVEEYFRPRAIKQQVVMRRADVGDDH